MMTDLLKFIGFICLVIIAFLGFGYGFMLLWNWLIPDLFNGPILTFWQGIGLMALAKILFGGLGGGHKRNRHKKEKWDKLSQSNEKSGWISKFKNMSHDEKKALKRKWKTRLREWVDEDFSEAKDADEEQVQG